MGSKITIMLVDDNPIVREMLRAALSPMANVVTFGDGADAYLKAVEDPPDLILTDYTIPGLDGRQLVEKLKTRANTQKIPVMIMAGKSDIGEKLRMLSVTVEDFIEKPFFVKEATARIKKVVDRLVLEKMAREAPGDSVLRGSLAQMNIMDLFQSLEMGHKSCKLTLTNGGDKCEMWFADGQVSHAVCGGIRGDEAVYKVVAWPDGSFAIDFTGATTEQSITRSTQGLLMEGLRLVDEAGRGAEENVLEG